MKSILREISSFIKEAFLLMRMLLPLFLLFLLSAGCVIFFVALSNKAIKEQDAKSAILCFVGTIIMLVIIGFVESRYMKRMDSLDQPKHAASSNQERKTSMFTVNRVIYMLTEDERALLGNISQVDEISNFNGMSYGIKDNGEVDQFARWYHDDATIHFIQLDRVKENIFEPIASHNSFVQMHQCVADLGIKPRDEAFVKLVGVEDA